MTLKLISRVWYFGISKSMLWLINFFLFDKSGARTLRMGCEQKFQSLNKIISKFFFSKIIFPKYPYKPYVTIKNIFGHIISHIIMFSTMFWVPGVTLPLPTWPLGNRIFDLVFKSTFNVFLIRFVKKNLRNSNYFILIFQF